MNKTVTYILLIMILTYVLFKTKKRKENVNNQKKQKVMKIPYEIIKSETGSIPFEPADELRIISALNVVKEKYGNEIANVTEKIFRYETAHFKSFVFKMTNGAGVIVTKSNEKYFKHRDKLVVYVKPLFKDGKFMRNIIVPKDDPQGKKYVYVIFPTITDGMRYLAEYLKNKGIEKGVTQWSGNVYNIETLNKVIKTKYT